MNCVYCHSGRGHKDSCPYHPINRPREVCAKCTYTLSPEGLCGCVKAVPAQPERVVSEQGGVKEVGGKLRWTLLPWAAVEMVVRVLEFGALKYERDNWQKVDPDKYHDALIRHVAAIQKGELIDVDSGLPHFAHIACDSLFLTWFWLRDQEKGK